MFKIVFGKFKWPVVTGNICMNLCMYAGRHALEYACIVVWKYVCINIDRHAGICINECIPVGKYAWCLYVSIYEYIYMSLSSATEVFQWAHF